MQRTVTSKFALKTHHFWREKRNLAVILSINCIRWLRWSFLVVNAMNKYLAGSCCFCMLIVSRIWDFTTLKIPSQKVQKLQKNAENPPWKISVISHLAKQKVIDHQQRLDESSWISHLDDESWNQELQIMRWSSPRVFHDQSKYGEIVSLP